MLRPVLLSVMAAVISPVGLADVVISEISGASSDRQLKHSESSPPSLGAGIPWFATSFAAADWVADAGPLGFGRPDVATDLSSVLQGEAPSLYLRKVFRVSAAQAFSTADLILEARFADGLIVFINGKEVERCYLGPTGMFVYSDQFAFRNNPDGGGMVSLNLGRCSDCLVEGDNVIAVQVVGSSELGPVHFDGALRIHAGITLSAVVSESFSDANGATRIHTNRLGEINERTLGTPVLGGWLARSPQVESGAGWEQLEVRAVSQAGGGEEGDGAMTYTVTATGAPDEALILFPPVDLADHWQPGGVTAATLAETRIFFRWQADPNLAHDFVVRSPDGKVELGGFPLVASGTRESVAYWRFDEENAQVGQTLTVAADSSGHGHTASPSGNGAGSYSSDVPGEVIFDPLTNSARSNRFSMDVSASGRRMAASDSPDFNQSFTAEMFIKIDGEPSGYNPFMRRQGSTTSRWQIDFDHAAKGAFGRLRSRFDTGDGANSNFVLGPVGAEAIPESQRIWIDTDAGDGLVSSYNDSADWSRDGNGLNDRPGWHHVALTVDQETGVVSFYFDYQLTQTRTLVGVEQGGYQHPAGALEFGNFSSTYALLMDEVRYTGRVLEPLEFLQLGGTPGDQWVTDEIDLAAGDPVAREAFLAHLNASRETAIVPGLRLREEGVSEEPRTLTLDQFRVDYAEGLEGVSLILPGEDWSYHLGTTEPSGGVSESGAPGEARREFVDWIELANTGSAEVDLGGWSLTDDRDEPRKWTFPSGTVIPADGHLLVLADELDPAGLALEFLHANFKLDRDGEYLALIDEEGIPRSEFSPGFPRQLDFHSFGLRPDGGGYVYFSEPTPGGPNGGPHFDLVVEPPVFGVPGGFHSATVILPLTSPTPGAIIRYTTDGSEPTLENGETYSLPLVLPRIDSRTGHVIRARAFANHSLPSKTRSATYLVGQSANIAAAPALLLSGDAEKSFGKPFGILAIDGGRYLDGVWEAVDKDDYNLPFWRGRAYERPTFVEYYQANSTHGFGAEGGIRVASSTFTRPRLILDGIENSPWQANPRDKPSFNLYFRSEYERSKISFPIFGEDYRGNTFEHLRPRAGKNDMNNPHIKDEVVRRLYLEMGRVGARGIFNSLYLNGEWKGFYNLCERLREPFFQVHYPGSGQWDIRQAGNPDDNLAEGDNVAWNELNTRLQAANVNSKSNWEAALELIDATAVADYFLLNIYGATWDWPQNNWVSARERSAAGRFRFYVWDAEGAFGHPRNSRNSNSQKPVNFNTITEDLLSGGDPTSRLFQRLHRWPEFRLLMADRIHKHFFNQGVLDDSDPANSRVKAVIDQAVAEVAPLLRERFDEAIDLEFWRYWSAPGASRRSYLLGPNDEHFRDAGYWPQTEPPALRRHGGEVPSGYELAMTAGAGTLYFTTDGSDPRLFGGAVSAGAVIYRGPAALPDGLTVIKARLRSPAGEWSALTEAEFQVGLGVPDVLNLVVSEIHYHPARANAREVAAGFSDQDDFEMIQLQNIGEVPLDLTGVSLTDGIFFDFAEGLVRWLAPGASVIVTRNLEAFRFRYGHDYDSMLAGEYAGSLSNRGERVVLTGPSGVLRSFVYDDRAPWPVVADGEGVSLILLDPDSNPDHSLAENWGRSASMGGHPGGQPLSLTYAQWVSYVFEAGDLVLPGADPDGDGLPNLIEFFLGSLPKRNEGGGPVSFLVEEGGRRNQTFRFSQVEGQTGLLGVVEASTDLADWTTEGVEEILPAVRGGGWITRTFRVVQALDDRPRSYLRLRVRGAAGD